MDPQLLRGAFRLGTLISALALVTLPFQERTSPEFVVTVMALAVGLAFLALVAFLARRAVPRPPDRGDKGAASGYNTGNPRDRGRRER